MIFVEVDDMGRFEGFAAETIDFLWELRMNNSREWMEQNRERYKTVLKEPFDRLAAELVQAGKEYSGQEMACSISRINRDIRFSKDKSPYRACRWVVLHGTKTVGTGWKLRPAFYFEMNPESYTYGMGLYYATPEYLAAFRRKIVENPAAFLRIAKKIDKDKCYRLGGADYRKVKDESLDPLLQSWYRKKELVVSTTQPLGDVIFSEELPAFLTQEWKRLRELYRFLDRIAEG